MNRLLASAAIALCATSASAWDLETLNRRADENLFQVGKGCSGTLVDVSARLILTAYHCIAQSIASDQETKTDEDGEPILGPDGKPLTLKKKTIKQVTVSQLFWDDNGEKSQIDYPATIVARDQKKDVAILQIPQAVGPVPLSIQATMTDVPLAAPDFVPVRGSTVYHIGNPRMQYGSVTKGIMSAARSLAEYGFEANRYFIQYDGGITGGSSGGALYSDEGTFIGITTLVMNGAQGGELNFIGLAVPMSDIWTVAGDACLADQLGGVNPAKCASKTASAK